MCASLLEVHRLPKEDRTDAKLQLIRSSLSSHTNNAVLSNNNNNNNNPSRKAREDNPNPSASTATTTTTTTTMPMSTTLSTATTAASLKQHPLKPLPVHPRALSRTSATFEESLADLLSLSSCGCPDLQSLIKFWQAALPTFAAVMKIGFGNLQGLWTGPAPASGVSRVSLTSDGSTIVVESIVDAPSAASPLASIPTSSVVGVELCLDERLRAGGGTDQDFNGASFSLKVSLPREDGGGAADSNPPTTTVGPFSPPTDLELKCWVLVLSTLQASSRSSAERRQGGGVVSGQQQATPTPPSGGSALSYEQVRNFKSCARMSVASIARRGSDVSFVDAYSRVREACHEVRKRHDLPDSVVDFLSE